MALNYYEGWSEGDLLTKRRAVQEQLDGGQITEIRLAGESTSFSSNSTPLEVTLERIAYALWLIDSTKYKNPYSREPGVTLQRYG